MVQKIIRKEDEMLPATTTLGERPKRTRKNKDGDIQVER
jgi:hypothetical protein